jgi:molybdopterin molybdotransferase
MASGAEDHVKAAVEALGRLDLWRLAIKPGRPVGFGQILDGEPQGDARQVMFIGLPGNPVAMMVTFLLLARPALLRLAGASAVAPRLFPVRAGFAYAKKAGRREWLRVRLEAGPDGLWTALRVPRDGTGILSAMAAADGLAELPEAVTEVAPGAFVDYLPFSEVLS